MARTHPIARTYLHILLGVILIAGFFFLYLSDRLMNSLCICLTIIFSCICCLGCGKFERDRTQFGRYGQTYDQTISFTSHLYTHQQSSQQYVLMTHIHSKNFIGTVFQPVQWHSNIGFHLNQETAVEEAFLQTTDYKVSAKQYRVELREMHQPNHPHLSQAFVTIKPLTQH